MSKVILGIQIEQRKDTASEVQNILTDYGCVIKTRLGLHNTSNSDKSCTEKGLILIEFISDADDQISEIERKLCDIQGIVIRKMEF